MIFLHVGYWSGWGCRRQRESEHQGDPEASLQSRLRPVRRRRTATEAAGEEVNERMHDLFVGSERASHFRQTVGGHLAVGSSILCKRSLDGRPPFAENDSLFRSLAMSDQIRHL